MQQEYGTEQLRNHKLDLGLFDDIRKQVLSSWPTGPEVNLEDGIRYQLSLPEHKIFFHKLAQGKEQGITYVQPRAGVALLDEHLELLRFLQDEGEADFLPTTIDSYTRHNKYAEAQTGIEESKKAGRSMLNGFPAVNYGVSGCRRIVENLAVPVQVRHGTPDARLLAEITLAGGFTDFEGGGISYNIPYAKDVPLERTIRDWQYVDRLVGIYEEAGARINREPFGPLTGTLVPPSVSHSVAIIEMLLAVEQGVRSVTLGYGQSGNLQQDVAALVTLKELADEFLQLNGYNDVMVTTVFHQWMGGFPQDESRAYGVIAWGAATAAFARASKVIVKTPHEAVGIPTREANAAGLKTTKQLIAMLQDQSLPDSPQLAEEKTMIKAETRAIIDRAMELGEGDIALGAVRAFAAGVIDVPFAPSRFNSGKILPARDNNGAVRFLDHGNLPFNKDIIDFHRDKISERGRFEGREPGFQMVIDDIYAISKGRLVGRPR